MTTLRTGIHILIATLPITLLFASTPLEAQTAPKPATEATKAANRALKQYLNFNDRQDFDNATRGFIGKPETLTIKDAKGNVVWDLEKSAADRGTHRPRRAFLTSAGSFLRYNSHTCAPERCGRLPWALPSI